MTLDISRIPESVLSDLEDRGYDARQVAAMDAEKAFSEYCNWNGLVGWGPKLFSVMRTLNRAEETGA